MNYDTTVCSTFWNKQFYSSIFSLCSCGTGSMVVLHHLAILFFVHSSPVSQRVTPSEILETTHSALLDIFFSFDRVCSTFKRFPSGLDTSFSLLNTAQRHAYFQSTAPLQIARVSHTCHYTVSGNTQTRFSYL